MNRLILKMEFVEIVPIILLPILFGICFGNILVIASMIKFEHLQTAPNVFIANLAAADILTGVISIPVYYVFGFLEERVTFCYIFLYASLLPSIASVSFLTLIAVDRTLCIVKPFFYLRNMTVKRAMLLSVGGWVQAMVSSFWPLILPDVRARGRCGIETFIVQTVWIVHIATFFFQTILFLVLYGIIGYVAHKQAQRIGVETACGETLPNGEAKIRKTMMMILGIFYLCWSPYVIGCMFVYVLGYHQSWLIVFVQVASFLVMCNSVMNPIIYACRDRTFRKAFKSLLHMKRNSDSLE